MYNVHVFIIYVHLRLDNSNNQLKFVQFPVENERTFFLLVSYIYNLTFSEQIKL